MITSEAFYYKIFAIMLVIGFVGGIVTSVVFGLTQKINKNVVAKNITQFFCVMFLGAAFFLAINFLNFGEFRGFLLVSFLLGFAIQHKLLSELIAKTIKLGYNLTTNIAKKLANTKFGKKLLR